MIGEPSWSIWTARSTTTTTKRGGKGHAGGRERYLAFTVEAMFQIQEQFDGATELIDVIRSGGREGFSATCRAAAILAEQGELARRSLGYDPEPTMDEGAVAASLLPKEAADLGLAITAAISLGFGREISAEDDEVDLGLAELNEQKKRDDPGPLHPDGDVLGAVSERGHAVHPW